MSARLTWLVAGFSDVHTRTTNQDRIYPPPTALPLQRLAPLVVAIADGMGGTQEGELAASLAMEEVRALDTALPTAPPLPDAIASLYHRTNQTIVQRAGGPGVSGTTLSLLVLTDERIWPGHLGDSRIYLWREQHLHALTTDDNAYGQLLRQGHTAFSPQTLPLTADDRAYLTQHQLYHSELFLAPQTTGEPLSPQTLRQRVCGQVAALHQQGQLFPVGATRERLLWALGKAQKLPPLSHTLPPHLSPCPQPGDLFLLSTDGLHGVLSHSELEEHLGHIASRLSPTSPQPDLLSWGSDLLLQAASDAGANDNISLLLVYALQAPSDSPDPTSSSLPSSSLPSPSSTPPAPTPPAPTASSSTSSSLNKESPSTTAQEPPSPAAPPPSDQETASPSDPQHPSQRESKDAHTLDAPATSPLPQSRWTALVSLGRRVSSVQVLWGIIAVLTFLLLWPRPPASTDNKKTPRPQPPRTSAPTGPWVPVWTRLPSAHLPPFVTPRLQTLRWLHRSHATATQIWQLSTEAQQRLQTTLQAPVLRTTSLRQLMRRAPLELPQMEEMDRALLRATLALLAALAPGYNKYLDEMEASRTLPPLQSSWKLSPRQQHHLRRTWLQQALRQARSLRWRSWRLDLLAERILHPPHPEATAAKAPLRRCLQRLQRAHRRLLRQQPQHPLLPRLINRIQLHQAYLRKPTTRR